MKKFKIECNGDVIDNITGEIVTKSNDVVPDDGTIDLFNQYKDVTNLRYIANQLGVSVTEAKKLLKR